MSGPILMRAKEPLSWMGIIRKRRQTCGSHCYNAKNDKEFCTCPCGGVNHGVGLAKAIENTKAMQAAGADVIFNEKEIVRATEMVFAEAGIEKLGVEIQSPAPEIIITKPEAPSASTEPLRDAKGHFIKRG